MNFSFELLKLMSGVLCNCHLPALEGKVQKEGPNQGKEFYGCAQYKNNGGCGFFQWKKLYPKNRPKRTLELEMEGDLVAPTPTNSPAVAAPPPVKKPDVRRTLFEKRQEDRIERAIDAIEEAWELLMECWTQQKEFKE